MRLAVHHPFCLAFGRDGVAHRKQTSWRSCDPSAPILSMPSGTLRLPLTFPMSLHSILKDMHTNKDLWGSGGIILNSLMTENLYEIKKAHAHIALFYMFLLHA